MTVIERKNQSTARSSRVETLDIKIDMSYVIENMLDIQNDSGASDSLKNDALSVAFDANIVKGGMGDLSHVIVTALYKQQAFPSSDSGNVRPHLVFGSAGPSYSHITSPWLSGTGYVYFDDDNLTSSSYLIISDNTELRDRVESIVRRAREIEKQRSLVGTIGEIAGDWGQSGVPHLTIPASGGGGGGGRRPPQSDPESVVTKPLPRLPRVIGFQGPPGTTGGKKGLPTGTGTGVDPGQQDQVGYSGQEHTPGENEYGHGGSQDMSKGNAPGPDPQPKTPDGGNKDNDGTPGVENTQTDQDGQLETQDSKPADPTIRDTGLIQENGQVGGDKTPTKGDPDPEDGGDEGKPSIPYGPRHNNVVPLPPNNPNSPGNVRKRYLERMLLARLGMYGYASGDDLGSAGYNPHFDPDPENTGASESGDGAEFGPQPNRRGPYGRRDESPSPHDGPDPDNEWGAGGYNPHYQPSGGYSWTPYSKSNGTSTLQQPTSRMASVGGGRGNVLSRVR